MTQPYTTPEQRLAAWLTKDPAADGAFIVGVKTTRIFCRPTCAARPKVENIEWFMDKPSAMAAGLRPCLRCKP